MGEVPVREPDLANNRALRPGQEPPEHLAPVKRREDQVGVLAELRQAGLIRHVGLSNVTLGQLRAAQSIVPVAAVTALYNVTARVGEGHLAAQSIVLRPTEMQAINDITAPADAERVVTS